jgi:spore cortex formation protein SpoVR/YcgB (stage V sporulation)
LGGLYNLGVREPNIQIVQADIAGNRSLTLHHDVHQSRPLAAESTQEVLRHLHQLWGFDVYLKSVEGSKVAQTFQCREPTTPEAA